MTPQAQHAKQKNNTAKTGRQSAVIPELQTGLDVLQRAVADPGVASPDDILALQRSYGNQAVTGLIQTQPQTVRRQEEEEELQMKSLTDRGFEVSADLEQRLETQKGNGKPLSPDVRAFMEPRFGVDFGDVHVHTDSEAVQMNRDLNARSFTHGTDIYFNADRYNPGSNAGKRLLAHELTHVVQQTGRQLAGIQTVHEDGYVQGWRWRTKKSEVYKGRVGGEGSQEKVIDVMKMGPGRRAEELAKLLVTKPVKNNLNGFNRILPLLSGDGNLSDQFSEQTEGKDLGQRIKDIFGEGTASRGRYLLDVLNTGKPTAKSKFALRAGLLTGTSFTFGRGSGRREHGVNKDLIELAQQLSREELNGILRENALTKPLTKKTLKLLQAQLVVKGKEEEEEGAEGGAQLVKQVELFKAYQDQLIKMVQDRPVRVFGSRSKHKKRLFNDLQQWAKDKPPQIIEKLLNEGSRFYQVLKDKYKRADVTYITKLMSKPEQKPETEQEEEQSEEEAAIFQQVEAIMGRQEVKWRFKRWRQKGNIKAQLEQLLFGEGGLENVLAAVKRQYGENWEEQLKDKFKKSGLKDLQVEELLSKFRYGKKAAGDIYQQLKKRVAGWRKRTRWSRTTLDLIQQLRPGTSEYELVRRDKALLRGIRRRSDKKHWAQARAVLNVRDEDIEEGALEARPEGELEQEAGTEWGARENESVEDARERQTTRWAKLIDAELTSIIVNSATLYKHVFNAQQDAWKLASEKEEEEEQRAFYAEYMAAIQNGLDYNEGLPERLQVALAQGYAQRLNMHDLMDMAKKRGGKRRTDKDLVKFAIEALSGKELLDEWSDFDEDNLILKVKAEWWDQKGEDHKSFRDLLKRPDRIEMERLLLGRLAKECQKAPEFKASAAEAMGVEDQDQAARYVAQRTRAIGHLETAQKFAKGKQWSRFSTRSLVYKEAQAEYLGKLRSTQTDIKTVGTEERKRKIEELEQSEETLKSEEAAFKALREKYNQRLKTIVTAITGTLLATLGLVFTGGLSAGPLMAGIWSALTAMISKGIGALVEYTNEGNIVVTDNLRELFVDSVIGFIGGIMGNVSLAIRSMGAQDLYGKSAKVGAKLFGKPGLAILGSWAQETATTVVGSPIHAVDRLLRSTSVNKAWQDARDNFKQKFENLPLDTLQSYAQGFLSSSFIETVIAAGGGDLLYQGDLPKEEALGEGKGGMKSRETFEKYGAIRPFEFNNWKGFWKSIVEGSQVNTTDYGDSFIVYKDGVPKGWELDTDVLKTDKGPQTLGNAFKAMGYKVAMGGLEWPFRKGISMVTGAQPTLTERKGKLTGEEYEKFGALRLGEGGEAELSDEQLTRLANLNKEQLGGLNREKLAGLADEFTGDELARLAQLTVNQLSTLDSDKLKVLAKLTANQLVLLQRSRSYSPDALANVFDRNQSAKFAGLTQEQFVGLLGGLGQLDELATLTPDQLERLAKLTSDQLNRLSKEQLAKLAKKFEQGQFEKLGSFEPQKIVALAQLEPGQLGALAQLSPEQIATLNTVGSLIPLAQKFDPGQIAKLAQLDPDLLWRVLAGKKRATLTKLSAEQLGKLVQLPGNRIIELTKRSQEQIVTELEK